MDRNLDIQKVFEIADDSLQGVLGYHLYIIINGDTSHFLRQLIFYF